MVVEAANWRQGGARPRHEVMTHPDHNRYIAGWMRPGDAGFVAVDAQDQPVGAAWYPDAPAHRPGFGYIGTGVPELIIGVRPIWRAHGVGRALLQRLCERARARASVASVCRSNAATSRRPSTAARASRSRRPVTGATRWSSDCADASAPRQSAESPALGRTVE
jgi:GNAT superfamily N-acetyltransferase